MKRKLELKMVDPQIALFHNKDHWEASFRATLKGGSGPRLLKAIGRPGTSEEEIVKIAKHWMEIASQSTTSQWKMLLPNGVAHTSLSTWIKKDQTVVRLWNPNEPNQLLPKILAPKDSRGEEGPAVEDAQYVKNPYLGLNVPNEEIRRYTDTRAYKEAQRLLGSGRPSFDLTPIDLGEEEETEESS